MRLPSRMARRSTLSSVFLQSQHLQFSPHRMLAWKHSQYFFRHPDLRQWQPRVCLPCTGSTGSPPPVVCGLMLIFALKADGLRSSVAATALRTASSFSGVLLHPTQLQSWQNVREAKHSQYSFKHFEFLQLQRFFFRFFLSSSAPLPPGPPSARWLSTCLAPSMDMNAVKARFRVVPGGTGGVDAARGPS